MLSDISGLGTQPSAEWSVARVDLPALEMASNKVEVGSVGRRWWWGGLWRWSVNKLGAGGQRGRGVVVAGGGGVRSRGTDLLTISGYVSSCRPSSKKPSREALCTCSADGSWEFGEQETKLPPPPPSPPPPLLHLHHSPSSVDAIPRPLFRPTPSKSPPSGQKLLPLLRPNSQLVELTDVN